MNSKRAIVMDLVVDYRCAIRDGLIDYAKKCYREIFIVYKNRHNLEVNAYGYPKCIDN